MNEGTLGSRSSALGHSMPILSEAVGGRFSADSGHSSGVDGGLLNRPVSRAVVISKYVVRLRLRHQNPLVGFAVVRRGVTTR